MAELKSQKFEIITSDYYSNCLIEAVKAKIHNPKIKITIVMPWGNEVFCPHVLWSDGVNDFDFGNEGKGDKWIKNWTLHKGHIRKRKLGFNEKYKCVCKAWHRRNVPTVRTGVAETASIAEKGRHNMTNDEALECFESDCETCQFKGRDCKSCRTKVAISALRREIRN